MRLLTRRTIEHFAGRHAAARQALADFCAMVEAARWRDANHLTTTSTFPARPVGKKRVVFNVKGNDYRVIASVQYADEGRGYNGVVRIHFVGTHGEYDSVDASTVEMTAV